MRYEDDEARREGLGFSRVLTITFLSHQNYEISMAIAKIAAAYHVNPVEGVLSHHMKQYIIDGNQVIMNRPTLESHCDQFEVGPNEVAFFPRCASSSLAHCFAE